MSGIVDLEAAFHASEPTAAEAEFFPTPEWAVHRVLEALPADVRFLDDKWLDPCVGDGALPRAVHSFGLRPDTWCTWDIRDTGAAGHVGDWLASPPDAHAVCVMNPPFSKALHFADRALRECAVVVMLQRLGWLASAERREWLAEHTPDVYVLPNRPDFDGRGGDSHDYAWFVWGLDGPPAVRILGTTPKEVRQAQKPTTPRRAPQLGLDLGGAA